MKKPSARLHFIRHKKWYRVLRRTLHVVWYGLAVVAALIAVAFVGARLLLGTVADRKTEIERFLSVQSGYTVRIDELSAYWDGIHPGLQMRGIAVQAPNAPQAAVRLAELRISLQLLPILVGRPDIHSAVLTHPSLTLERSQDGRFRITGFNAIEQPDTSQNEAFIDWLFRQDHIVIEDGELTWIDRREPDRQRLTHVNLQLDNRGDRHRLGFAAQFPEGVCNGCSLVADIRGNPFLGDAFDGSIYLRAHDVDVERMPPVIQELLPETLRGEFSVELWSEWNESRPVSVDGDVSVTGLRLPLPGLRAPLSVKRAASHLRWRGNNDGFDARLDDLTLALHGAPWSAGRWQYSQRKDESTLRVQRLNLNDVTAFIASLRPAGSKETLAYEETAALWSALKPTGIVKDLHAQLKGALDAPEDYTFAATAEQLAVEPYQHYPGIRGANGRVTLARDHGEVALDMRKGELLVPKLFRAPLPISRAATHLRWTRESDQWLVETDDIVFENEDGKANGRLQLRLPHDTVLSPHFALNVDFRDANGNNAGRYFPVHHLSPRTLAWMEQSFGGGTVGRGSVVYDGNTREFPFPNGEGKFEIRAKVRDAVYNFLPGWAPLTDGTADVLIEGEHFVVTGEGRVGALKANEVVVADVNGSVRVRANVAGPMSETLRVLRDVKGVSETGTWKRWLPPGLEAAGDGTLSLDLNIPITGAAPGLEGEYRFARGSLRLAGTPVETRELTGSLAFTDAGVRTGKVDAVFLGETLNLEVAQARADETTMKLRGKLNGAALSPVLGPRLGARVSGTAPWEARLRLVRSRPEFSAEATLTGLQASLPAPLNRPNGIGVDKLIVRTEAATRDSITLNVDAGNLIKGRVRYGDDGGWRFQGGRIIFNEMAAPISPELLQSSERGLHWYMRLKDFDLDQWLAYLEDGRATETPVWLARVGAEVQGFVFRDRPFGRTSIDLARDKEGWSGAINGASAVGRLRLASGSPTRIELDLTRLVIPASANTRPADGETDPRKLPRLSVRSKTFQYLDKELGEIDFLAYPTEQGWRIERAILERPESTLNVDGWWRREHAQTSSQFSVQFKAQDMGATLSALGIEDQLDGGEGEVQIKASWTGAPAELSYPTMNGTIHVDVKKGRFLQVKQGAARMFGLLDLAAIGRYLTLDFSPIFGKGFAFDHIEGKISVEHGVAYSDEFTIRGPSAKILTSGSVGLVAENFHLVVDVFPSLSSGVTLLSIAGGPQVVLWSLIAQRLFKKQIEEGMRVTYVVNGPWRNPTVSRKLFEGKKPVEPAPEGQQ